MDSAVLLDLLGNENRRRILRLLSHKPCYVTEISEYLGVSPKAVIDHLRRLEESGLVESHTDDQRRKYFHISRNLRLEVNVSPHSFGIKSAYPANPSLDMNKRCLHLSVDVRPQEDTEELADLAATFRQLEELENELSLTQRWVHGRITEVLNRLNDVVGNESDSRFYAAVLGAVAEQNPATAETIAEDVDAPREVVEDALGTLADRGVLAKRDGRWHVV